MRDRVRMQRKRAHTREEQQADLASTAGVSERPSSAMVGGRTGVLDTIVAEASRATQSAPTAALGSTAVAEIVEGTIAQVIGRAADETPGYSYSDLDIFPREEAQDDDGASGAHSLSHSRRSGGFDDSIVSSAVADSSEAADTDGEEPESAAAEAVAVEVADEKKSAPSAARARTTAAPAPPPPTEKPAGETSAGREVESIRTRASTASDPGVALDDAVSGISAIEQDVERVGTSNDTTASDGEATREEIGAASEDEIASDAIADRASVDTEPIGTDAIASPDIDDVEVVELEGVARVDAERGEGEGGGAEGGERGGKAGKAGGQAKGGKGKGGGSAGKGGAAGKAAGAGGAAGGGGRGGGRGAAAGRGGGELEGPSAMGGAGAADVAALPTSSVALIDEELVEHQRWGGAQGAVGEAGSLERAAFVADTAGGAALSGLASGAAMGLGIGLAVRATKFIPGLGGAIGGAMALHGLSQKFENWDQTAATISRFGEGNSTYETLANSIASVAEVIDIVSNVLNAINGVVGVLTMICYGITAAGAIATVATLGAAAPVLAAAAEMSVVLTEIETAITAVTTVLDVINAAVLQPAVLLFRAMHTFTSEADPREVEASGGQIAQAAAAWGGTLGAKAGGALADIGSGAGSRADDENSATQRAASADADANAPPPSGGAGAAGPDGPAVHFEAPPGAAAVDPHAPTNLDIPAAHADTVPMPAVGGAAAVDVNAPTNLDTPAAHADTVPMAVPGGGRPDVDAHAPTNVDTPAAHADTVPMAASEPGVSPLASTGEMPAAGVSPMARSVETPVAGGVDPFGRTAVDPLGQTAPQPVADAAPSPVDPFGRTEVDPLGRTAPQDAADGGGATPNDGAPAGAVEPPPNAQLGGVEGWPPHDPYPGDHAPMLDRLAWGARQYEPGGQWHSEPLPPPAPRPAAPEPVPQVGPPRNPVIEMTPVNPADVYPGAPQPPGFRAGPVGSLGGPDGAPASGTSAPAPAGPRNPVMEMTPVNPADVHPGAPQPPYFQAGPVGSLDLPPATSLPATLPGGVDGPAAHAPTNLDVPAAHAPTNLDIPEAHAPTERIPVIESDTPTLQGLGPSPNAAAGADAEPVQAGHTLPGIGPAPDAAPPSSHDGGGGGSESPPPGGHGGSGDGGGPANPFANLTDAEIEAGLDAPGHSDLILTAPAPAAPTRFSDASEAEIEAVIDRGVRQAERRGTVEGQRANLSDDFRNLTPAEEAALLSDPGTVRPRQAPDQPGPGGSRHNISNGMMVDEVTIRAQSGRPGETGDVPTVIRIHTADPDPDLPATSNSASGNTVTITQGNQGARGQGVRMVPTVDADGNPVQTWHPTATASDDVMNASHIPIHRDPPPAGGLPPQTGGTLPGVGPDAPNGSTSSSSGGAREPSVIVDEAALGLPPGSVVTTEPSMPRPTASGPQTDVDWSHMRVEYDRDPAGNITGSRLVYDHNGKSYPVDFNPQVNSFDPSAPPGPGPFAGQVGMPDYRHAPTTLADGTVVQHPPEFKPEAYITTTPAEGGFGVRVGPGGAWMDHTFRTQAEADAYMRTVAHGDPATGTPASTREDIRDRSALPVGWAPDASGKVWPGNPVDRIGVHPLPPHMPQIFSQVAPQPEGDPSIAPGRVYPGGGPQVQIPKGIVHPGSVPVASEPIRSRGSTPPAGGAAPPGMAARPAGAPAVSRTPPVSSAGPAAGLRPLGGVGGLQSLASESARSRATQGPPAAAPSTAEQVGQLFLPQVFGPDGQPQTPEQRAAAHNAHFTGDNGAPEGVERVNPEYPEPPGTPQQLAQIQTEIANLLAARARTERAERNMAAQEAKHRAGEAPVQQAIDDTSAGVSASRAHEQSVARRAQANQEQQQRQQQGAGLVSGYPSRAAGLTAITLPLAVFEGFTRFASILPGDAGDAMARMNADARRLQDAFAQMAATMLTQEETQPARQAELQGDQQRLQTTDAQAADSSTQLVEASQGAKELQRANQEKLSDATQAKQEAAQQKAELGDAATQKQEQAQTLSTQLEAWAPAHKGARDTAVQETEQRLQQEGYVVLPRNS